MTLEKKRTRHSLMRAAIALILFRRGVPAETIDEVMNESYELAMQCKEDGTDLWDMFVTETGLEKI